MAQLKVGPVTFTHTENFSGEVEIRKGDVAMKIPMETLIRIVAEKVRASRIDALQNAKPSELIAKLA